jgi:tetratricopeptide (TPR) repeat protein
MKEEESEEYKQTILKLGESLFYIGRIEEAKNEGLRAIELIPSFQPLRYRAYCLLISCYITLQDFAEAHHNYESCIDLLEFLFGNFHPLYVNLKKLMVAHYLESGQISKALRFLQSSLMNCLNTVGANHELTGQANLDLAHLYINVKQRDKALHHFEKAFYIFEASKGGNAQEIADISLQISMILYSIGE